MEANWEDGTRVGVAGMDGGGGSGPGWRSQSANVILISKRSFRSNFDRKFVPSKKTTAAAAAGLESEFGKIIPSRKLTNNRRSVFASQYYFFESPPTDKKSTKI